MAQQFAQYAKQSFRTRKEAEAWAKEKKSELKAAEVGVLKIDIDFNEKMGGEWVARLLLPV